MKNHFVADVKAGDSIEDVFVLSEKTLAQKKDGTPYLNVTLSDKTGSVKGVVWDGVEEILPKVASGDVVRIKGNVSEYRGELQVVVKKMEPLPPDTADPMDFMAVTGHNIENMFERLAHLTASMNTGYLKALFEAFWKDPEFVRQFKAAPAAKKMHHAYIGGLLEHTLSMAVLTDRIAGHYTGIDRDMLLAGVILHDIGKVREFEYRFRIDYSDEGRLLSHIVIGLQMVEEKLAGIKDFPQEQAVLLKHMIVSHHGAREFGSPELPKTIEAVLLNYIDEIDSKVNGIRDFMAAESAAGLWRAHETWTSYHKLLGRHFYTGKNREGSAEG